MKEIKNAILMLAVFTILLGIVYPLVITGISQLAFPTQANGNLITQEWKICWFRTYRTELLQSSYFHGRPSVISYNSSTSGGSNLGPTNQKLIDEVKERIQQVRQKIPYQPMLKFQQIWFLLQEVGWKDIFMWILP